MADVEGTLRDANRELEARLGRIPVPAPPTVERRPGLRIGAAILASGLAVGILVVTAPFSPDTTVPVGRPVTTPPPTPTEGPPATIVSGSGPVLGDLTGVVLLFDHGTGSRHLLAAIDLDKSLISESRLGGLRPGDPPYGMLRVGDSLVSGWGEIYASDIATREETHLGQATVFVPAAEDDRVWMIRYPGGRIGTFPTVWQVGLDGRHLTEPVELEAPGFPIVGIPGGLALQTDTGLDLWNVESGVWASLDEGGGASVLDSVGNQLVWCPLPCTELVVTFVPNLDSVRYPAPDGYSVVSGDYGHLSPDSTQLAVLLGDGTQPGGVALWVLDLESGEGVVLAAPTPTNYVSWSPSGSDVFATSDSYGGTHTSIWWYDMSTGDFLAVTRELGGLLNMIAVSADEIDHARYFDPENLHPVVPKPN